MSVLLYFVAFRRNKVTRFLCTTLNLSTVLDARHNLNGLDFKTGVTDNVLSILLS